MKRKNNEEDNDIIFERSFEIMKIVMDFLMLFMPEILAKRLICVILLCTQVENSRIIVLSGYCERSVRYVKSKLLDSGKFFEKTAHLNAIHKY